MWRKGLWAKLQGLGFEGKMLLMLQALYKDVKGTAELGDLNSREVKMNKGLKQGCNLSPILFALYLKDLGEQLVESGEGVTVGDTKIPGLFFADDMAVMADSDTGLAKLLGIADQYGKKWKFKLNGKKAK